jgi:hypothetical protein
MKNRMAQLSMTILQDVKWPPVAAAGMPGGFEIVLPDPISS